MMFDATRSYEPHLDVRDWERWRERLRGEPEGVIWALVGPRRSGKTWALKALESRDAAYIELSNQPDALWSTSRSCLLVDEPGKLLMRDRQAFVQQCYELKKSDVRTLVAMTPGEWACLAEFDVDERHVKSRDRLTLPLLSMDQAKKIARTEWAHALLKDISADWRRNPFLLEFLFETAEDNPELRNTPADLVRKAVRKAALGRFRYVHFVFNEGLSRCKVII